MFEYHPDLLLIIPTYPTYVVKPTRNVGEPTTIFPVAATLLPASGAVTTIVPVAIPPPPPCLALKGRPVLSRQG